MIARYSHLWKVLSISLVFFAYQSIANSVMGIMAQITDQNNIKWAGPVTTMLMYSFSGLGSIYNKYVDKVKYKYTFYIGSFGYVIYVASTIVFTSISKDKSLSIFIGTCLINIIGGLIASVLYNSQWNYLSRCSSIDNASMYFGINMGIIQASNLFGNLFSSYIIQLLGQTTYCIVMTILISSISILFLFTKQVQRRNNTIFNNLQIQNEQNQQIKQNLIKSKQSQGFQKVQLAKMIPSFYFSGTVIAFVYNFISVMMLKTFSDNLNPIQLNTLTFRILMVEGAGEFLGALFYIIFSGKQKKKILLLFANKLFLLVFILILSSYFLKNIYLLGTAVVILGFIDCLSYSLNLAIISEERWSSFAYSIFNLSQCMGVVVSILLLMWISIEGYLIYTVGVQILSSILLHNFKSNKTKSH